MRNPISQYFDWITVSTPQSLLFLSLALFISCRSPLRRKEREKNVAGSNKTPVWTAAIRIPPLSYFFLLLLRRRRKKYAAAKREVVNAHGEKVRTRDVWRKVVRSERGVRSLFAGFKPRLLHVGIVVTLQLLIYDYAKRLCGIAATGSIWRIELQLIQIHDCPKLNLYTSYLTSVVLLGIACGWSS